MELEAYNRAERKEQEGEGYLCSANPNEIKSESQCADSMKTLASTFKLIQDELKTRKHRDKISDLTNNKAGTGNIIYLIGDLIKGGSVSPVAQPAT